MLINFWKRFIPSVLIFGIMLSVFACSNNAIREESTQPTINDVAESSDAGDKVDNRFLNVNYDNREFRVYTSVDASDATNANEFIEGLGEQTGDIVNDAVYARNLKVEELLGVKLKFIQSSYSYDTAANGIRTVIMSGSDDYDLIINDLRAMAALSIEGMFHMVSDKENFDFSKSYWYEDFMEELQIIPGYSYLMAGDYFMDVIASCHALFYNKQLIENNYSDPDYIYNLVLDGNWTYDEMIKIVSESYVDIDGNGAANLGDQFGFTVQGSWGCAIPFVISSGIKFIDRASGVPEFAFNNERSISYVDKLNELWNNNGTIYSVSNADVSGGLRNIFANSQTVIVGYQRLGDLMKMRDITFDIGIIPYPKVYAEDDYITSAHDTTEIGVIPLTSEDLDFITTVTEVLNRETLLLVIPEYYETALKVKYTTDVISATMIDIIHDSFGSSFPLAYSDSLTHILLETFTLNLPNNANNFASIYATKETTATTQLEKMIDTMLNNIS